MAVHWSSSDFQTIDLRSVANKKPLIADRVAVIFLN